MSFSNSESDVFTRVTQSSFPHKGRKESLKGACSEIIGKLIFFKLADMVTFPTKTSSMVKKLQQCISFVSNWRKQCLCYLLFYKWWKPRFLNSKRVFRWFLLNYIKFARQISLIRPSKYDSTFGTKISICLKKVGGWGCGSEQAPLILSQYKLLCKSALIATLLVFDINIRYIHTVVYTYSSDPAHRPYECPQHTLLQQNIIST